MGDFVSIRGLCEFIYSESGEDPRDFTYYFGKEAIVKIAEPDTNVNFYNNLYEGAIIYHERYPTIKARVLEKLPDNKMRLCFIGGTTSGVGNMKFPYRIKERPDMLFADIINSGDVIDLRHQVSLTGFNYQQLLEENFDKLLRGDLQTKERKRMVKTYHGIPKTPIDEHTVFYASLDGTDIAEIGGNPVLNTFDKTYYMPTGYGRKANVHSAYDVDFTLDSGFTIDYWMNAALIRMSQMLESLGCVKMTIHQY